jgi:DNA-binding transcriptional regulator YbjK
MPTIPEYNAPQLDIRPSEIGVESVAAAGRRLGVYGSQIAQAKENEGKAIAGSVKTVGDIANDTATHLEVAQGARHGAALMASATQGLNSYMSGADIPDDPNDPNAKKAALDQRLNNPKAAQQWIDKNLEPSLESFQAGFLTEGGQQYAQRFTSELRSHMTTAAMADQSTAAGIAMKDNLQKTADGYATAAFNSHNLHDVTGYINAFDHAIGAISSTSPTINADGQARIKEWAEQEKAKIVTSAVQGRIMAGGSYQDITKAFPQYVQPGQNAQFEKQEQFYQKSIDHAQKSQIQMDHFLAEDKANTFINDAYSKYAHPQPDGTVRYDPQYSLEVGKVPTMFRDAPNAVEKAQRQQALVEASHKAPPVSDNQETVAATMATITDPKASHDEANAAIDKAAILKTITPETERQMRQLTTDLRNLNDPVLTKTMEAAKAIISPSMGAAGQMNPAGYQQFYYDFIHNHYLPDKVAGKDLSNALNLKDPESMISKAIEAAAPGVVDRVQANGGVGAPLPVYTAPAKPAAPAALPVGTERSFQGTTYKFKGGNQLDKANWEPVS